MQIAVQMAVVFAKVARVDYPKAWPSLFTDLLQQMQSQNTLVVRRVYLVLHHALKELASKRLSSDQKAFAEASDMPCLCPFMLHHLGGPSALPDLPTQCTHQHTRLKPCHPLTYCALYLTCLAVCTEPGGSYHSCITGSRQAISFRAVSCCS